MSVIILPLRKLHSFAFQDYLPQQTKYYAILLHSVLFSYLRNTERRGEAVRILEVSC
jgi:hypothetical protein